MERAARVVGQVADEHPEQHQQRHELRRQQEQHRHERQLRRHGVTDAGMEAHAREQRVGEHERDRGPRPQGRARVAEQRERERRRQERHADRELGAVLVPRRRLTSRRPALDRLRLRVAGRQARNDGRRLGHLDVPDQRGHLSGIGSPGTQPFVCVNGG
jgi:hypothetical protein